MAGINEAELEQMKPKAVEGEVLPPEDEYEDDPESVLMTELKATRDCLAHAAIFFQFYQHNVRTITKREQTQLEKICEQLYSRMQEVDQVIESYQQEDE